MARRLTDGCRWTSKRDVVLARAENIGSSRFVFPLLIQLVVLAACARTAPAGFWTAYKPDLIERQFSDQGPWGGARWITWASPANGTFNTADVLRFAKAGGWSCEEPKRFTEAQMQAWQFEGGPVFPLHVGPPDRVPNDARVERFPRHIIGDSLISECKTGWVRIEPGTDDVIGPTGFIQIEASGARMAIYHLWGEN